MSLRLASVLLLGLALPACSRVENGIASMTDGLTSFSGRYGPTWGGMRPTSPDESLTVQRIRTGPRAALGAGMDETLRTEPGDMWPAEDAPRATLANPDQALRGIPNLRQGMDDPGTESRRRGSSTPPDLLRPPSNNANNVVQPSVPIPDAPPRPFRTDRPAGVIDTPSGPLPTTNRTGNISTTITPQGSGTAIRNGNTTTIFRPDGNIEQVPTPR